MTKTKGKSKVLSALLVFLLLMGIYIPTAAEEANAATVTEWTVDGSSGKATLTVANTSQNDPVLVLLEKRSKETNAAVPQGGATLGGAEYTYKYYDGYYSTEEELEGKTPLRTWVFKTDSIGLIQTDKPDKYFVSGDEFYYMRDGKTLTFPLGTYTIQETKAPEGYLIDDALHIRTITSVGSAEPVHTYNAPAGETALKEQVKRGDLAFTKVEDSTMSRLAGIPFKMTSKTTGESHIVVTDDNGYVSTDNGWNNHSQDTNQNDEAYNDETGEVDESKLNSECGIWFGGAADGTDVPVNDELGALPYDTYIIDELEVTKNAGKTLIENLQVRVYKNGVSVDLGTITNDAVEINTTATDKEVNSRKTLPRDGITITDKVKYEGVTAGQEYTMITTIMDKGIGEAVQNDGKAITGRTTFTPTKADGVIEVDIAFDAEDLAGKEIVIFEELVREEGGGELTVATHEDLDDVDQTIEFVAPNVGTLALDSETKEHMSNADDETVIIDTIEYEGLLGGQTYTIKGTIVDAETGTPIEVDGKKVTATKEVQPNKGNGTATMEFTFKSDALKGKKVVVFEELYWDEYRVAKHVDPDDEQQTVIFPDLKTTALDSETKSHTSYADKEVVIEDTVKYTNLIPGKEYTVNGKLVNKENGEALKNGENEVTATTTFTAEEESGSAVLEFKFDASALKGQSVVAFETLKYNDVEVAVHADVNDMAQTVEFPEIGTKATVKDANTNVIEPNGKTTIIDTVSYKNLRIEEVDKELIEAASNVLVELYTAKSEGREFTEEEIQAITVKYFGENATQEDIDKAMANVYVLEETLMNKQTGKPYTINDKEVTAYGIYNLTKESGELALEFPVIDTSQLDGTSLVVYEKMHKGDALIASHEDINDEAQTITIQNPRPPQTGQIIPFVMICLAIVAITGIYVIKNRRRA